MPHSAHRESVALAAKYPRWYPPRIPDANQPTNPSSVPTFDTAQYAPKGDTCAFCRQPVGGSYYRVKAAMACRACGEKAVANLPKDSHVDFMRGLLFGTGGAVLGIILYSTFAIASGLVIGYVALAVGYIVGKAIQKGARGAGGQRYQIAAVCLTYAAVSLSAIPIGISYYVKNRDKVQQARTQHGQAAPQADPDAAAAGDPSSRTDSTEQRLRIRPSIAALIPRLLWAGLTSPITSIMNEPSYGAIIGIVILFVGLRIAWQITAHDPRNDIVGPFAARKEQPATSPLSAG